MFPSERRDVGVLFADAPAGLVHQEPVEDVGSLVDGGRDGARGHAQLQREAQLVAGTSPGPDVLQVVIYAVTYAQVIWAQMAILILTFVGPMMIPWLVFEPMAFLFWGWFRSMITFALYGAIAGAIMRVFMSVSLGFLTTFLDQADVDNPVQMVSWLLILLPLMVAGVLASLKHGR